jgi:hypothetical protein
MDFQNRATAGTESQGFCATKLPWMGGPRLVSLEFVLNFPSKRFLKFEFSIGRIADPDFPEYVQAAFRDSPTSPVQREQLRNLFLTIDAECDAFRIHNNQAVRERTLG